MKIINTGFEVLNSDNDDYKSLETSLGIKSSGQKKKKIKEKSKLNEKAFNVLGCLKLCLTAKIVQSRTSLLIATNLFYFMEQKQKM